MARKFVTFKFVSHIFSSYLCARFAKVAYQGVLVRLYWLRSYPSYLMRIMPT